ncbi:ADP-ribosylation factor [Orobanche minor]
MMKASCVTAISSRPVYQCCASMDKHQTTVLKFSDTSTHGGFSVPRRHAEKLFPQLDYSMQPLTQELVVQDLHDNTWTFRHIYQDKKSQMLLRVRRANRQQMNLPSSILFADHMHIGILAAAAHASANRTLFIIFYNPRACPSEFVITLARYRKQFMVHSFLLTRGLGSCLKPKNPLNECPKQPSFFDCGYYVMKYIEDIIKDVNILKYNFKGIDNYSMKDLSELCDRWATYVAKLIIAYNRELEKLEVVEHVGGTN